MSELIKVDELSKTFGGQLALDSVSLTIETGEIRALVGQNGCGKSTLIKILAGFHEPDVGGSVHVDGSRLAFGVPGAAAQMGLRFVHQDLGLVSSLNSVENMALGRGYETNNFGMIRWKEETRKACRALLNLGYEIDVLRPVGELAISERTAVAIARALAEEGAARLMILDEPTANLQGVEAQRLYGLIRNVASKGIAVLFVSHHFDEVFELADTVTVLRDGRLVETRSVRELTEPALIELVVGKAAWDREGGTEDSNLGEVVLRLDAISGKQIRKLSLEVRSGEVLGVAGISGSGREELIGLIFGSRMRTGRVLVQDELLETGRPSKAVALGVGMVPAERLTNASFSESTLRENVTIVNPQENLVAGFLRRGRESSDVQSWLGRLNVKPAKTEAQLSNLSGGNQQKVILARWLRLNPRVLLLDEPTQGVDVAAKREIHQLISAVAVSGTCVVVASTDHQELVAICHRILILKEGHIFSEVLGPSIDSDRVTSMTIGR